MSVIKFPGKKYSTSAGLRASALAKPIRHLETTIIVDGGLAEAITLGAGRAGVTPSAFIIRALSALFDGGHAA